jgi:hypothetical protein
MTPEARLAAARLPWHRETIGHANIGEIADIVGRDLAVPLPDGIPPSTDATWIVNGDLIIQAVADLNDAARLRAENERLQKENALLRGNTLAATLTEGSGDDHIDKP